MLTPLRQIHHPSGDILHAMKASDESFQGFGEVYFSMVHEGVVKGWKKHTKMTLNLVVPTGAIEFVCFDGKCFEHFLLSKDNYQRLTVSPDIWMAFRGKGKGVNLLLNIANIEHDPREAKTCKLKDIDYVW